MAFALGIPFSITTIAALVAISTAAGRAIHMSYDLTEQGVEHIKSGSAVRLIRRCTTIAEMLHTMSSDFLISSSGQAIIQTLVNCIEWGKKYDKKSKVKRIYFSNIYKERFDICHDTLTHYLQDMAQLANISTFLHFDNISSNNDLDKILAENAEISNIIEL